MHKGKELYLSTKLYVNTLLEKPYDTNCDPSTSRTECYYACLRDSIGRKYVPYVNVEEGGESAKLLTYTQMTKPEVYSKWRESESTCENQCRFQKCQYNITNTMITGFSPIQGEYFKVTVESPIFATNIMFTLPRMMLYELVYQTMCCFSFWLGFSVAGLNPHTLRSRQELKIIQRGINRKFMMVRGLINKLVPFKWGPEAAKGLWCGWPRAMLSTSVFLKRPSCKQTIGCSTYIFAGICCTAHIFYSIQLYLSYPTYIDVSQDMESGTKYSMHYCLDIAELLARQQGLNMTNLSEDERTRLMNATVSQIFAKSPSEDSIIKSCSHWGESSTSGKVKEMKKITDRINFFTPNVSTCLEPYSVRKMIVTSLLCYIFTPNNFAEWSRVRWRDTLNDNQVFYSIVNRANKTFSTRFTDSKIQSNIKFFNTVDRSNNGTPGRISRVIKECEKSCLFRNDHIAKDKIFALEVLYRINLTTE